MKSIKFRFLFVLLLVLIPFVFTACGDKAEVAAIVNGEELMLDELEDKLDKYIKALEAQGYTIESEEQKNEFRKQLLNEMIEVTLLKQAAVSEGISIDSSAVNEEFENIKKGMGEEALKKALDEVSFTEEDFKEIIEQQLIVDALFNKVTESVTVEEEKMLEFYEENKDNLVTMKVSHILIEAREGEATEEERAEAKKKAEELIAKLNDGADFAELAAQYSDDPGTAADGGLLDYYFTKNDFSLDSQFVKGSYELQVGEYSSEPVEGYFGYHIILAEDKKESFEDLKEDIERYLTSDEKNAVFDKYFNELYEQAEIKNFIIEEEQKEAN